MNLPLDSVCCLRPSEHPSGTLLAIPRRSKEIIEPCWAVRFDYVVDGGKEPWLLYLNEPPFGPRANVAKCRDFHSDDDAVLGTIDGMTERTVEIDSKGWIPGSQIAPDQAAGLVAIGEFGFRVIGWFERGYGHQYPYIDGSAWTATSGETISRTVTTYAKTWCLRVRFPKWDQTVTIPFDPNPHPSSAPR